MLPSTCTPPIVPLACRRVFIWPALLLIVLSVAAPARLFGNTRKGLTWGLVSHNSELDIDRVGCYGRPRVDGTPDGPPCNPYKGDTPCSEALPILCLKKENLPRPNYPVTGKGHAMPAEYYNGWAGGHIALTRPVRGDDLTSLKTADAICSRQLGPGYRMAEHHDGMYVTGMGRNDFFGDTWPSEDLLSQGGWHWYAYGSLAGDTRFWVYINDQEQCNCWRKTPADEDVPSSEPAMKPADVTIQMDPKTARNAHPGELSRIMQSNPSQKLLYMGSDKDFHYIYHSWTGGGFRVPVAMFTPRHPFPVGSNRKPYPIKPGDLKNDRP